MSTRRATRSRSTTDTTPTLTGAGTSYTTVVVENAELMDRRHAGPATLYEAGGAIPELWRTSARRHVRRRRPEPRGADLVAQAQEYPGCPFAENLEAQAIQNIINSYRTGNLKYVVIVGDDDIIPFFRYPDSAGLAPESTTSPRLRPPRPPTPPCRTTTT